MSCYICDPERKHMASMRMHVDEWNEGCEDCFRDYIDAFIVPDDELPGMWERADFEGGLDEVRP